MSLCKVHSLLLVFLMVLTVQLVQLAQGFADFSHMTVGKNSSPQARQLNAQPNMSAAKINLASRRSKQERLSHHNSRLSRSLLQTEQPLTPFSAPLRRIEFAHLESPFSVFLDGNMRPPCASARDFSRA